MGTLALNYPIPSPMNEKEIRRWLRIICFKCGNILIPEEKFMEYAPSDRFAVVHAFAKNNTMILCAKCKSPHPVVGKDKNYARWSVAKITRKEGDSTTVRTEPLYPHKILEIFERITDNVLAKIGRPTSVHPRNMIMRTLPIPAVSIRVDSRKMMTPGGGKKAQRDNLTSQIQRIVNRNKKIDPPGPGELTRAYVEQVLQLDIAIGAFIRGSAEEAQSIAGRLKGKTGQIRATQLGKRVFGMCRATIAGDPTLRLNEITMPLSFAQTVQIEEIVQPFNREWIMTFIRNGRNRYPGCSKIIKHATGAAFTPDSQQALNIENGDIIFRDVITGDYVGFNRQPSLAISNITAMRVIIDPGSYVVRMNVLICPYFNADFDGDQMNLIIFSGVSAINEIKILSTPDNWYISHTSGSPQLKQTNDSIIGMFELTEEDVYLNRMHAAMLFSRTIVTPVIPHAEFITGRDAVSLVLKKTPINFNRVSKFYNPSAPWMQWMERKPNSEKVEIVDGELRRGCLDQSSLGDQPNGLYHCVATEHGPERAMELMFDMQQLAIAYILQHGFTIGIRDLIISDEQSVKTAEVATEITAKAYQDARNLLEGKLIPRIGETVRELFETLQINTLRVMDDFAEPVIRGIDPKTNGLFRLVATGSKGSMFNVYNICSANGQTIINKKRPAEKFSYRRCLPYYRRGDPSPEAHGYIANSYINGLAVDEFIFNAMNARYDLISKALFTSITGTQNRDAIKNLESIITNNFRMVVKGANILQMAYGSDFLDPRFIINVEFPTAKLSDADFVAKYRVIPDGVKGMESNFADAFEMLRDDRQKFRDLFMRRESIYNRERFKSSTLWICNPINVIASAKRDFPVVLPAEGSIERALQHMEMLKMVLDFCSALPYLFMNSNCAKKKSPIPHYIRVCSWLSIAYIRAYFCPAKLRELQVTPEILKKAFDVIQITLLRALIDPGTVVGIIAAQAFSAPFTQEMLDAHKKSSEGGTSTANVSRSKEILSARDVDRMAAPCLTIPLSGIAKYDMNAATAIANELEVVRFRDVVDSTRIFFEKYGQMAHTLSQADAWLLLEFEKLNKLYERPGDLANWCIRFELNRIVFILKNIGMDFLVTKLREKYPNAYIVNSTERASNLVIRFYFRATMSPAREATNLADYEKIRDGILNTILRGIDNIHGAKVEKLMRSKVRDDGAIGDDDGRLCIKTDGSNIAGVSTFLRDKIVWQEIQTNAIQEVARIFGIEAARQKIIVELQTLIEYCNQRHYMIYADEMTSTGVVTSIERSGLNTRDKNNIGLRLGYAAPVPTLSEASSEGLKSPIEGPSSAMIMGTVPFIGTIYNAVQVDPEVIQRHIKSSEQVLAELQ
jgi:DNA-directed RNA polymerase beta' subunit